MLDRNFLRDSWLKIARLDGTPTTSRISQPKKGNKSKIGTEPFYDNKKNLIISNRTIALRAMSFLLRSSKKISASSSKI